MYGDGASWNGLGSSRQWRSLTRSSYQTLTMASEPVRFSNADEAALEPTERREIIHATLTIQRGIYDMWGRWASVKEIEEHLTGKRSL